VRRLFIIRKDLHLAPGKLAAMVSHCAEGYWTTMLKNFVKAGAMKDNEFIDLPTEVEGDPEYWVRYRSPRIYEAAKMAHDAGLKHFRMPRENPRKTVSITVEIPKDVWFDYVEGIFTKTICEAKNLNHLMKVVEVAKKVGLEEGTDYGFIDDVCKTDLTPEFTDENGVGRCRVGIWFKPLPDDVSHTLSKKYQLYKD
jgi:peptidyl-tRNA hydrolase